MVEIKNRENMSKTLNKYIIALDYADMTLVVLSGASSDVSLCSFTTVFDTSVGLASELTIISPVFLLSNEIVKMFLETMGKKENKNQNFLLYCPEAN